MGRCLSGATALLFLLCTLLSASSRTIAATPAPPPLSSQVAAKVKALDAKISASFVNGNIKVLPERRELLKLLIRAWGKDSPHLAQRHFDLAGAISVEMAYFKSRKHYERAAELFAKLYSPNHEMVATCLQMASVMAFVLQDIVAADRLMERSMEIRARIYGEQSLLYTTFLQIWGQMLQNVHGYDRAELIYRRCLNILTEIKGPNDHALISPLRALGWLFYMKGDFVNGDKYYLRSVELRRRAPDSSPASVASMWISLGEINQGLGRTKIAKKFYGRAHAEIDKELTHLTNKFGATSATVRSLMLAKAKLLMVSNRLPEAMKLFKELKRTQTVATESATLDFHLATLALANRDFPAAVKHYEGLARYYEKNLTKAAAAGPMAMLAVAHKAAGDYKLALRITNQVHDHFAKTYGPAHRTTLGQVEARAVLLVLMGKPKRALQELEKVHNAQEPYTNTILAGGTEGDNRQYLARIAYQLDAMLTVHRQYSPNSSKAAALAMRLLVRRKGRILDAVTDTFRGMRRRMNATDRALLDQLRAARTRLSKLVITGPGTSKPAAYQKQLSQVENTVRRLEGKIRKRSAAFKAATTVADLPGVAKAIPKDALLVEFVAYRRVDLKLPNIAHQSPLQHYAAYTLDRSGRIQSVDLGPAGPIDTAITAFRKALADPNRDDVKALSQTVYTKVFKRLESLVGSTKRLILSPDGAINLVPFAALVDDQGRFLVRRFLFSYVSSGRDLVRFSVTAKHRSGPTIVANPNFDGVAKSAPNSTKTPTTTAAALASVPLSRGRLARALRNAKWKQLPGTGAEATAVAAVLKNSVLKTGKDATEAVLKALKGPKILHIATHGFFLPHESSIQLPGVASIVAIDPLSTAPGGSFATLGDTARRTRSSQTTAENPLLRSGLALDGANQLSSGLDDGVLTALEASDLDLWGTQLVVLSACETGVGEVRAGDGVHGLRRALTIAGAQSLVMSLWQVDDDATKQLMTGYYKALGAGKGRAEGLRQVQLKMLQNTELEHPFFWAAFIPAGRWQPLDQ